MNAATQVSLPARAGSGIADVDVTRQGLRRAGPPSDGREARPTGARTARSTDSVENSPWYDPAFAALTDIGNEVKR